MTPPPARGPGRRERESQAERKEDGKNWYLGVLREYATFEGRARRKEYWMFCLFNLVASCALATVDVVMGTFHRAVGMGVFSALYSLAMIVPSIAVSIRRLHDTDRGG